MTPSPSEPAMDVDDLLWSIGFVFVGLFGCIVGMALDHEATAIAGWWVIAAGVYDVWRNGR